MTDLIKQATDRVLRFCDLWQEKIGGDWIRGVSKDKEHALLTETDVRTLIARIAELEAGGVKQAAKITELRDAAEFFGFFGNMFENYCDDKDGNATILLYDGGPPQGVGKVGKSDCGEEDLATPVNGEECLFGIWIGHKSVYGALLTPVIQTKHFTRLSAALRAIAGDDK